MAPVPSSALVTDVHLRSTLGGIRGLGTGGIEIVGLGPHRSAAGLWSRYASHRVVAPDVLDDPAGFARAVARAAEPHAPCIVYPSREESVDALLTAPLPDRVMLPYAGAESLCLRDKSVLGEQAPGAGLSAPRTYAEATAAELRSHTVPTPCVVKTRWPGETPETAVMVVSAEELERLLGDLPDDQVLIVQEHVSAPLLSLALVIRRDGGLAARFQQRITHTWPAEGGTTRRAIGVAPDASLVARLQELLGQVGFWGLAQFDILDAPSGAVVLDVNPRFFDSMPLAIASGVNLPAVWHAVAEGDETIRPADYRLGVRFRWLQSELLALHRRAPGAGERSTGGPVAPAVWSRDDPVPSVLNTGAVARELASRTLSRTGARLARRTA